MAIRRRTILIAVAIVGVFALALIFAVPALIHVDRYRPEIISYLHKKTGKDVEIGRLALTMFPVSIEIDDLGFKNPSLFPPGYILKVSRVDAILDGQALLHRQVVVKSLVVEDPVVNLISDPDGPWNFENPQAENPQAKVSQGPFPLEVIAKVKVERGQVQVSNLLPSDAPGPVFFEAHDITSELEQVNLVAITNALSSTMDGQGTLQASRLRFGSVQATKVNAKIRLEARQVFFTGIAAEGYGGKMGGDLTIKFAGKNPSFTTDAHVRGIEMSPLLAALGTSGGRMTGRMEGDLKLAGQIEHTLHPLAGLHGSGRVTVRNGEVPSLELNANLMRLVHFNDLGPAKDDPASFNMITTDVELAEQRIVSKAIDIDGYGVDVDGSGSVSVSGSDELSYQGVAQITTKQGFFTNTFARMAGATMKDGKLTFPFRISGTIETPVFSKGADAKNSR
jgi:uncharacterized protein involved in outer membrane biogenesis